MSSADTAQPDADIVKRVIHAVATVLDCDGEKINVNTSLHSLGAESLDYLDIAFSLERDFNIHFPRVDALQRAISHFGEDKLWVNGNFTSFGKALLVQSMPEIKLDKETLRVADLRSLLVVGTLVRVVTRLLKSKAELSRVCPKCSGTLEEVTDSPELRCASCGHTVPLPSGDDVMTADLIAIGNRLLQSGGDVAAPAASAEE